jgi:hypothetical protein
MHATPDESVLLHREPHSSLVCNSPPAQCVLPLLLPGPQGHCQVAMRMSAHTNNATKQLCCIPPLLQKGLEHCAAELKGDQSM